MIYRLLLDFHIEVDVESKPRPSFDLCRERTAWQSGAKTSRGR